MVGVLEVLMLLLSESRSRKTYSVFLFLLLCPTQSLFPWDDHLLRFLAHFDCSSRQQQL